MKVKIDRNINYNGELYAVGDTVTVEKGDEDKFKNYGEVIKETKRKKKSTKQADAE